MDGGVTIALGGVFSQKKFLSFKNRMDAVFKATCMKKQEMLI